MADETVTVTWGEEVISPVQYQSFRVGPFTMTTKIKEGESTVDAMHRAYAALEQFARNTYPMKRKTFLDELSRSDRFISGGYGG